MGVRNGWLLVTWTALYLAWIASELLVVAVTYTRRSGGAVQDRGTMRLLWITNFLAISAGWWVGAVQGPTIFHGARWVLAVAVAMLALGLAVRWTAIVTLGRAFSVNVAILEGQHVMRSGLFRWVRHPSYTGLLLALASMGVATRNWLGLAITIVPTTAALLYRIRVEEAALTQAFGQEYVEYSATTRRLIPGVY